MAELTREETIVLNALVYLDYFETDLWDAAGETDNNQPKRLGDIVRELKEIANNLGENEVIPNSGGMTKKEEFDNLFRAVEKSPSLKQLELLQISDSDYKEFNAQKSDAPILTFRNGDNPIVVFRGTQAGTGEELDNYQGGIESDTEAQKRALDYITILHDKYGFDSISVSGHSKGGNKAMYVTVLSDYVSECTAIDAPGFSAEFEEKYRGRIDEQKDKITLIAPDQTWVATFFSVIAGNVVYISTEGLNAEDWKLEPFPFHKPNTLITIDDTGNIQMREEAECSMLSKVINGLSKIPFVAAFALGLMGGEETFPKLEEAVLKNFTESTGRTVENWMKGIYPDGSPSLSTHIMNFLGGTFPGLKDVTKGWQASLADGSGNGTDILTVMQYFGESIPILAARIAEGTVTVGGMEMAVGSGTVFVVVAAVTVVWAFVKTLELVIPLLLNAGIAASEICGFALGLTASWIMNWLSGIGQAVESVRAVGNAVASAVGSFIDGIAGFFGKVAEGTAAWVQGIFGSADAAIAYAQDIDVTMSRIEEMRVCLENLRKCYMNAGNAAVGARQMTDQVYSYYHESYVRSCCRDIQYHLKSAGSGINSAEHALDRKRRVLAAAVESYRRNDREAAEVIRRYAYG